MAPETTQKIPRSALVVAVSAATLGIIYGYDQSNIAGANLYFQPYFNIDDATVQSLVAAVVWGEFIGALTGGLVINSGMVRLTNAAAAQALGIARPPLPEPGAPGPFSMGDSAATEQLFRDAGFTDVRLEPVEGPFLFAGDGADAVERILSAGPMGPALLSADESRREAAVAAVVAALADYRGDSGFEVPAASWCITAARP